MSNSAALLKQAQQTEVKTDHSKATKGGPRLPAVGKCPARLIGYVELGVHPQPDYAGKSKQPEMEVQLTFECFGKNNMDEIEVNGKKKTVGRIIRPLPMTLKLNERAKFYKLFQDMDYGRGLDHMSKMLNDVFRLTISHEKSKKGTEYAKIDAIESPLVERIDPETGDVIGTTDISEKVPPASFDLQLFIVEKPTFEQWDSIEIEGTWTKKTKTEEGEEVEEEMSKNFLQEKIMESLDWEGSAMQTLLLDLGDEPEDEAEEEVEEEEQEEEKPAPKKKAAAPKKAAGPAAQKKTSTKSASKTGGSATTATKSPSEDTDDLMKELGL